MAAATPFQRIGAEPLAEVLGRIAQREQRLQRGLIARVTYTL